MNDAPRLLLLTTAHTYRTDAFQAAADRLGVAVVPAVDMPRELADYYGMSLGLDFADVDDAVTRVRAYARQERLDAVLSVDDSGGRLAAALGDALGLPHNDAAAAEAARDKHVMRRRLAAAGEPTPDFRLCWTTDDITALATAVAYPCVVKPTRLSGSRGVIRADTPDELIDAVRRLQSILTRAAPHAAVHDFLIEGYIPGVEVALEGLLDDGRLEVLALFDKPDPLEGPFFEETIYVTPSRRPSDEQRAIAANVERAAQALGLRTGPVHAELRLNENGPWLIELAGRSIGGLCSRTLRFGFDVSLEELILRQALNLPRADLARDRTAAGVMMIPIPEAGLLKGVAGCAAAEATPLVEGVEITAPLNHLLTPLPEGESYLGFIFARGPDPAAVEAALRQAHACLRFDIAPHIPLTPA